jgi:hypothetical protein
MHAVIETPTFIRDSDKAGVSEGERHSMVDEIAANPIAGDLIPGTGGARKIRFAGRGKGKSGGYRVITYFAERDVPVVLLALVDKGERADISQADKNALRDRLSKFADAYRKGIRERIEKMRNER